MRRTYTCRLEFAEAGGRDPITARALTKQWLGKQYEHWPENAESPWLPSPGVSIEWRVLNDPERGDEVFDLAWSRHAGSDPTLVWRTSVRIAVAAHDLGNIIVSEQVESAMPKVREVTIGTVTPPGLVGELLKAIHFVDGGSRVQPAPVNMSADLVTALGAFVGCDRKLPVVVVAPDAHGVVHADANGYARELAGLVHVVLLLSPSAVDALTEELGSDHSVSPGGVRLFWPDWRSSDAASRHRAWRDEDVKGPRVLEELRGLVIPAGALRIEDDPLVARLARARPAAELRARREEREAARSEKSKSSAAAETLIVQHETEIQGYQDELSEADERFVDLEVLLDKARSDYQRALDWYSLAATQGRTDGGQAMSKAVDVIKRAAEELPHIVVLPEAIKSAKAWQYDKTDTLWEDLVNVEAIATAWERGGLRGSFGEACTERGLDWTNFVSESARLKYGTSYARTYEGQEIVLGPHLRYGGRQLFRIYFYLDDERHRVVMGHAGGHLKDSTT